MPDEDFWVFLCKCTYIGIFHIYMPHMHLYTGQITVCFDLCIFDRTCIIDIFDKCYSYTASAFSFQQGSNVFLGGKWSDLFLLVWRQKWDFWVFKVLRWILSCSNFLLIFITTVHIFFAGLYIGCKCNIDIAPCIYQRMPCLTVEIGRNFGESHNPPGMVCINLYI